MLSLATAMFYRYSQETCPLLNEDGIGGDRGWEGEMREKGLGGEDEGKASAGMEKK